MKNGIFLDNSWDFQKKENQFLFLRDIAFELQWNFSRIFEFLLAW